MTDRISQIEPASMVRRRRRRGTANFVSAATLSVSAIALNSVGGGTSTAHAFTVPSPPLSTRFPSVLRVSHAPTSEDILISTPGAAENDHNDADDGGPTDASSAVSDQAHEWIIHTDHAATDNIGHAEMDLDPSESTGEILSADVHGDLDHTADAAEHEHTHLPPSERRIWEGATWREKRGLPNSHIPEKLFNAGLLALSFGFAFYTVINIDSEITRGWTSGEVAMRIPLDTWSSYEASLSSKPIETKTLINVVIYLLGDWLSQTIFQKKDVLDFDAARTLRNGFIGLCFGPLVHQYYEFSDAILPVEVGINRLYKILMDQTIYIFVKCSVYIVAVGILSGQSFEESYGNARDRIKNIMFTAWKFWPLVHCITYSVIPAQHRILWVNSVDLIWNAILASISRGGGEEDEGELSVEDQALALEFSDLERVPVMDETVVAAAVASAHWESSAAELVDFAVVSNGYNANGEESTETPRLTLLEQYRRLEA